MAAKKQQKPWQYKVSFGLVFVLLLLVFGYFWQSFMAIREMQPIRIAVERLRDSPAEPGAPKTDAQTLPKNPTEDSTQ